MSQKPKKEKEGRFRKKLGRLTALQRESLRLRKLPQFGIPLEELQPYQCQGHTGIPQVLVAATQYVAQPGGSHHLLLALRVEGIFRITASRADVEVLKLTFESGGMNSA